MLSFVTKRMNSEKGKVCKMLKKELQPRKWNCGPHCLANSTLVIHLEDTTMCLHVAKRVNQ